MAERRDGIRTLIVDDEPLARRRIRKLLQAQTAVEVVGEATNGSEAIALIPELAPDLVFLDVQMPELSGFDVIEAIGPAAMPAVIFVTAYDEYALRAFDVHALDYLLKPFDDERFAEALARARRRLQQESMQELTERLSELLSGLERRSSMGPRKGGSAERPTRRFPIKSRGRITFVESEEIDWIEAEGDYVRLHTGDTSHLVRATMKGMEERLDPSSFLRIHRSAIVRIDRIRELTPYFHGEFAVILDDGTELRLSRTYRERASSVLNLDF